MSAAQSEYARLAGLSPPPAALMAAIESYLSIVCVLVVLGGAEISRGSPRSDVPALHRSSGQVRADPLRLARRVFDGSPQRHGHGLGRAAVGLPKVVHVDTVDEAFDVLREMRR